MGKKEKIIVGIIVLLIVGVLIFLFFKVFSFNVNVRKEKSIDDTKAKEVYEMLTTDEVGVYYTFYNAFNTKYSNLSPEFVSKVAYLDLTKSYEKFTQEEFDRIVLPNLSDELSYDPITKINGKTFNDKIKSIFGDNVEITNTNFVINETQSGYYDQERNYVYIYESNDIKTKYYTERKMIGFEEKNNGDTLIIYDYFIKCEPDTKKCYNDDHLVNPNNNVTLDNIDITKGAKYKHTFKKINNKYVWDSSNLIAK